MIGIDEIKKCLEPLLLEPSEPTGYAIFIDGKRFQTWKGKKLWNKEHHAKHAFRTAMEWYVNNITRKLLIEQGHTDYYYHDDYKNAWNNFLKEINLEIIELK